jgi:broad specificity phosphatase PhoE
MLRDARIAAVFASDLQRTIQTAQPTADQFKLTVSQVPGGDPIELRKRILAQSGKTVLAVGHSDTIPALIKALGGPTDVKIDETEFDRLFILHVTSAKAASLVRLRYGAALP